jgi:hypothetical protein
MILYFKKMALMTLMALLIFIAALGILYLALPNPKEFKHTNPDQSVYMLRYCDQPCDLNWTPIKKIPNLVKYLVIRKEDSHFFAHNGFNTSTMFAALKLNLRERKYTKGASTISMQLARNLYLYSDKTLFRKLKELLLTYKMEYFLSKERILELYLNVIEFAPNIYGIANASEFHFDKNINQLTLSDISHLVAILPTARWTKKLGEAKELSEKAQETVDYVLRSKIPDTPDDVQQELNNCKGKLSSKDESNVKQALYSIYKTYGTMIEEGDGALLSMEDIKQVLEPDHLATVSQVLEKMRQGRSPISCQVDVSVVDKFDFVSTDTTRWHYRYWVPNSATESLNRLISDANNSGHKLRIESAYRGAGYQLYLIMKMLNRVNFCPLVVAKFIELPDRSEHACYDSVAIDFSSEGSRGAEFEKSTAYQWLLKHAVNYNFSLSYDNNTEGAITFEPWHWRYKPQTELQL